MHAIRDALNLGKVIRDFGDSYPDGAQSALESYHHEILERGGRAVLLSRNAFTHSQERDAIIMAWGSEATSLPEEKIVLDHYKP
ncbi:hypothetical protein RRF57_012789 [Xylaria bambusicola]|uniref:Uncharacterized protein n=1 Tax=Xylaria bambusicola TaxID=326684 RepID=A0AAN7UVT4_9PEZI